MANSILEQIQQKLGWYAKNVDELPDIPNSFVASDEVKRLMKYHGIPGMSPGDKPYERVFFRDGKKVRVAMPRQSSKENIPFEGGFF